MGLDGESNEEADRNETGNNDGRGDGGAEMDVEAKDSDNRGEGEEIRAST